MQRMNSAVPLSALIAYKLSSQPSCIYETPVSETQGIETCNLGRFGRRQNFRQCLIKFVLIDFLDVFSMSLKTTIFYSDLDVHSVLTRKQQRVKSVYPYL